MNTNKENYIVKLTDVTSSIECGRSYIVTIKAIHKKNVHILMPNGYGHGKISGRCWGDGYERKVALSKLSVGDNLVAIAWEYNPSSKCVKFVLSGCEYIFQNSSYNYQEMPNKTDSNSDPQDYQYISYGTTLLIDMANLIGLLGPKQIAYKLRVIKNTLIERGFTPLFFLENSSYRWTKNMQETYPELSDFKSFCRGAHVRMFDIGADPIILTTACVLPNSVCISRDHFKDLAAKYPEIVGTHRHRGFTSEKIDDNTVLSISGLRDDIIIKEFTSSDLIVDNDIVADKSATKDNTPTIRKKPIKTFFEPRKGLLGVGDAARKRGCIDQAITYYSRIAHKHPSAYFAIADIYENDKTGLFDTKLATKYIRLGEKNKKRIKQYRMRKARLRAETYRAGHHIRGMRAA